jgi:hypothetical protein
MRCRADVALADRLVAGLGWVRKPGGLADCDGAGAGVKDASAA